MKLNKIFSFLCVLLFLFLIGCSNELDGPEGYDALAKCLTEKGAKMYGTEWCSHCQNQKEEFGNSFQYVDYVDCDEDRESCVEAGIRGYPTWRIDGQNYPGEQSLERLAALSGCN